MTRVLENKTAALMTLGCKLNQYESMSIRESLEAAGIRIVAPEAGADLYVINTCTVTGKTDRRSRNAVRRVLKWNPDARIVVTGCSSQRQPEIFQTLPNVFLVTGNREKLQIRDLIEKCMFDIHSSAVVGDIQSAEFEGLSISTFGKYSRAFLKIQEGCSRSCSYCVIPSVRGPSRSQISEKVIEEATRITANGFKEIVLTGIDLGTYGLDLDPPENIVQLISKLLQIPTLARVRLSSIEPTELMSDLIDLIISEPRICRHLHVPLQSGSPFILERMHRSYSADFYRRLLVDIKTRNPFICFGADVIVGFPGESDSHFEETYEFIKSLPFSYLHVFTFSPRAGTRAARFDDQINVGVAKERCHRLRALSVQKAIEFRKQFIGSNLDVIILNTQDPTTGKTIGLSDNYLKIQLDDSSHPPGSLATVSVTGVVGLSMEGRIAD